MTKPSTDNFCEETGSPVHILIIEGNEAQARRIKWAFSSSPDLGRLSFAHRLSEARTIIATDPPGLIIADSLLPDGTGIEIVPRADGRVTTPVIILSGYGDEKLAVELLKSGAIDYVVTSERTLHELPHIAERALREWKEIQERKRAEEALARSETKFRAIYETSPYGIALGDRNGRVLASNPALARMLGYSKDELYLKHFSEFTHPDDVNAENQCMRDVLEGKTDHYVLEKRYIRKDGATIWVRMTGLLLDETLLPAVGLAIVEDITDRKIIEQEQKVGQDRLETAMNIGNFAWWEMDLPDGTVRFHPRKATLLGYRPDQFSHYRDFTCLIHPDDYKTAMQSMRDHLEGRSASYDVEYRIRTASGDYRWFQDIGGITSWHPDGKPSTITGMVVDITRRKETEEAFTKSESRYRRLFESIKDAVGAVDMDGRIVDFNPAFREMVGYTDDELGQLTYYDLTPEKWHQSEIKIVEEQVIPRGYSDVYEKEYRKKEGSVFPVELRTFLIRDENGEPAGMWGIIRDITERKRAQQDITESEEKYRTVFAAESDSIFLIDRDSGAIFDVNDAACKLYGFSREEMLHMKGTDISAEPDESLKSIRDLLPVPLRFHKKRDGTIFPVEISVSSLILKGRRLVVGVVRDITKRELLQQLLVEEKDRAKNLLDIAGVIILALDTKGVVTLINKRGCEILGSRKEEITGKVWVDTFLPERCRGELIDVFHSLRAGNLSNDGDYENPVLTASGEERIISWKNTVIYDKSGLITGTLSSGQDVTEQRKAEAALLRANTYNRSLIEASLDPLVTIGPNGKITDVNRATENATGCDRDHLIGSDFSDYFTDPDNARAGYLKVFAEGLVRDYPLELRHLNGSITTVLYNASVYRNEAGEVVGVFAAARDITGKKHAEEAVRQSEIRFRSLIQNSSDIIRILDESGRIVYDSPSSERILGYPAGFFIGKFPLDFVHPEDHKRVAHDFSKVISKENPGTPTEFRMRKADGDYVYVDSVGVNLIGVQGIDGIVITTRPIHERKMAELALRESEEQYRLLFENANDAIFLHEILPDGSPGRFIMANSVTCRQLGYSYAELMQMTVLEIIAPAPVSRVPATVERVERDGHATFEEVLRRKDGAVFPVEVSTHCFELRGRKVSLSFARDITERKAAEQEMIFRNALLAAQNEVSIDGILVVDENQKILLFNNRFIEMWNVPPGLAETGHDNPMLEHNLRRVSDRIGFLEKVEYLYEHQDVKSRDEVALLDGRFFDRYSAPMVGSDGRYYGRIWYFRDITEDKKAENLLRENEARLGQAMDLAKLVNWEYDVATDMFTFNDGFYSLFATTAEKEGGYSMPAEVYAREFVHPEDSACIAEAIGKTMTTTDPLYSDQVEHRIIRRDGEIRYIAVHVTVVFDTHGNHIKNRGVNQDITERKRYELAISESEEKFRTLVENVVDVFYRSDRNGILVYASPSVTSLTGYPSPDDLIGRPIASFWANPQDRERMLSILGENGSIKDYEVTIVRFDGTEIPVSISSHFYCDDTGAIAGVEGLIRDISERKKFETELRESEEKFRMIFDTDQDALVVFEISANGMPGKIIDANVTACTQLDYSKEELQSKTFFEINADEYWEAALNQMAGLYLRGYGSYESVRIKKDGARFPVEVQVHRMKLQGRDVIVSSARDISDRRRQEKSLKISNQKLHLMNIVAWHDIQNKITGLRGYVELTKDIITDEKAKAFVRTEEDVLRVIDQQIQYTKEYQQMGIAPPQWLRIFDVLRRVFANQNTGSLDVAIDVGDLEIFCDPTVEKAFSYLAGFTLEPTRHADVVRIYLQKKATGMVLFYDDNGTGIPLDKKKEIFQRDVAKFSGFGMFFIHDILDISEMSIQETGDPENGVRFEITIPKGVFRFSTERQMK